MTTLTDVKKSSHKILVCDDLAQEGLNLLREDKHVELVIKTKLPLAELKKEIADAEACVVRSGTQLTAEVIEAEGVVLRLSLLERRVVVVRGPP